MEKDIKAIRKYIKPRTAKEMKSFLGLGSYERKYIPRFAQYEKTLRGCITNKKFVMWTKEGEKAFEDIKKAIANSNMLAMFMEEADTFILCDASGKCLGATLMQVHGKEDRVICYARRSLS
jgi:RNase H-like domain found in reverse transcriptase